MKIAYIISAYKLPEQLVRLVERLDDDRSRFLIHVDRKTSDQVFRQMRDPLASRSNVQFLTRYACYWGGFGHVRASLAGIAALIQGAVDFDYVVLLTGQDYPIKSNHAINTFFASSANRIFMEYFPLPHKQWEHQGMDRIERWHIHLAGRYFTLPRRYPSRIKRRFPAGYLPFGGSSYWCLTRACTTYIYDFVLRHPEFVRFFAFTEVPDELFFQTIVLNSPFAGDVVNDNLRYIDWKDPHAPGPGILGCDDLHRLAHSPALFARKFDQTVDAAILNLIDQRLLQHGLSPSTAHLKHIHYEHVVGRELLR